MRAFVDRNINVTIYKCIYVPDDCLTLKTHYKCCLLKTDTFKKS